MIEAVDASVGLLVEEVADEIEVDLVVMAGGPAGSFHRFVPSLRQSTTVPCVPAELGVRGPMLGAAMLVGAGG